MKIIMGLKLCEGEKKLLKWVVMKMPSFYVFLAHVLVVVVALMYILTLLMMSQLVSQQ